MERGKQKNGKKLTGEWNEEKKKMEREKQIKKRQTKRGQKKTRKWKEKKKMVLRLINKNKKGEMYEIVQRGIYKNLEVSIFIHISL